MRPGNWLLFAHETGIVKILPMIRVFRHFSSHHKQMVGGQRKATYQEEYRGNSVPNYINTKFGSPIMAPNTPYVAASSQNSLYFIDTRHDAETVQHIKNQVERAMVAHLDEYISVDEIAATAEVKNSVGKTVFVFDLPYARVLFAEAMKRHNPSLQLP
ncbi:hypothetical protein MKX08_009823 [Trichoderma sp. CBMAI-0020]|nr:hypothetical protein MKX08_009823 [Trichoderma sp. CBMAI-0020]